MTHHRETEETRNRYNRIAPLYDAMEVIPEMFYKRWRKQLWSLVSGQEILEAGIGTGKNIPYYPNGVSVTGIDISERMLVRAESRATNLHRSIVLHQMDVQQLSFDNHQFDATIATFVFCSVPDPLKGLQELARVTKREGKIVLLEHMRANNLILGQMMGLMDPFVHRLTGPHIARRTVDNVIQAGLDIEQIDQLDPLGIFRLIQAIPS